MKLIIISQPRGAHAEIYVLLKETVADAYLVCGDLLDMPFYSADAADSFSSLQDYFLSIKSQSRGAEKSLKEIAVALSDNPDGSQEIRDKASLFLGLLERARTAMLQKYRILDNVFSTKPYVPVYSLPGCTDMDLRHTALMDRTIHNEARKVDSLIIFGLGCPEVGDDALPCCRDLTDAGDEVKKLIGKVKPHVLSLHGEYISAIGEILSADVETGVPLKLVVSSSASFTHGVDRCGGAVLIRAASFSRVSGDESGVGGFFYECLFSETTLEKITLKKLAGERVIDVAEYNIVSDAPPEELIIDGERFRELSGGTSLLRDDDIAHVPEIRLFRDVRNFFRIHQTRETEIRVERLQNALDSMNDYRDRMALDLVGSANVGLSGKSSDVDMVLYLRAGKGLDDDAFRKEFDRAEKKLRETLGPDFDFEVIDRINLDDVDLGVLERNYDCDITRLFVTYRSACRPVNYRVLSQLEDRLNNDKTFRQEMQEQMRSYLRMFARTSDNSKSFEKYLLRLKTSGVAIPEHLEKKINLMLQKKKG